MSLGPVKTLHGFRGCSANAPTIKHFKMKSIRYISLLIIILISVKTYSCDCKRLGPIEKLRQISFDHSDIVFLGELVEVNINEKTFTFNIIESFKGKFNTQLIKGESSYGCSFLPRDKCRWIVYAKFNEKNLIEINQCLASRSELNPYCISCGTPPPPPKKNMTKKDKRVLNRIEKQ